MFQDLRVTSFTFSHLDATVNGNIGYDAGTYEETAGPAGAPGMTVTGKYLVLLKRGEDGWKAAYVIFNFDGPPPPCGQ
jgi:ketosteroid isomerase-like protein